MIVNRTARRFLRAYGPVETGQTKAGFVIAAVLVALWLVGRPIAAQATPITGSSEDQHIRVEWLYDLNDGYGVISLWTKTDSPDGLMAIAMKKLNFATRGLTFSTMAGNLGTALDPPQFDGIQGGRAVYRYGGMYDDICFPFVSAVFYSLTPEPLVAAVTFPKNGIEVFNTTLGYEADIAPIQSSMQPAGIFANSLNFVSVQTIPEPPAAGLLVAGGAAIAASRRRKRGDEPNQEQ